MERTGSNHVGLSMVVVCLIQGNLKVLGCLLTLKEVESLAISEAGSNVLAEKKRLLRQSILMVHL